MMNTMKLYMVFSLILITPSCYSMPDINDSLFFSPTTNTKFQGFFAEKEEDNTALNHNTIITLILIMNQWWEKNQISFPKTNNNPYSFEDIALIYSLLYPILRLENTAIIQIQQACQNSNNLIKKGNSQLLFEIQTVLTCINLIDQQISPLKEQPQKAWKNSAKILKQSIKLACNQADLSLIQQKHVMQILHYIYHANQPIINKLIQSTLNEIDLELQNPIAQPQPRAYISAERTSDLVNKDHEQTWHNVLRSDDDNEIMNEKINNFIASCYISLDMQYAVLSLFNRSIIINSRTGKISDIPTIENIVVQAVELSSQPQYKETIIKALAAADDALQIALFVASTEQLYSQTWYMLKPTNNKRIINALHARYNLLKQSLYQLNPSWTQSIWKSTKTVNNEIQQEPFIITPQTITNPDDLVIPKKDIQKLLNSTNVSNAHDYTKLNYNPTAQANLLFEQCFIAQKSHLYFPELSNLRIKAPYYLPEKTVTVPAIIKYIQTLALENMDTPTIHQLLLDTRLAIQTALDIATRKSDYIGSSLLNPLFIRDPLVAQLQSYDADITNLISQEQYGANAYDKFYAPLRDYITIGLIKGTYFAGAALAAYITLYAAYQHGGTILTTAYIPFFATAQVMSWMLSIAKSVGGTVIGTTNKVVDTAISPLESLSQLVFDAPKKIQETSSATIAQEKTKTITPIKQTDEKLINLPSPQMMKDMLNTIQQTIDDDHISSQQQKEVHDTDQQFGQLLPSYPDGQATKDIITNFEKFIKEQKQQDSGIDTLKKWWNNDKSPTSIQPTISKFIAKDK